MCLRAGTHDEGRWPLLYSQKLKRCNVLSVLTFEKSRIRLFHFQLLVTHQSINGNGPSHRKQRKGPDSPSFL